MKADLVAFTRGRRDWPRRAEFRAAGLDRLYQAIHRAHVRDRLAHEVGLFIPPDRKIIKGRWSDPAITEALDELLPRYDHWPCRREFKAAGLAGLEQAIQRSGRREEWARRYGVPVLQRRAGSPA